MGFGSPTTALIAAGITIPLLVSLYFLKRRRRQVTVSSTLLWTKAIQDLQVNTPFQKLRRNLLLLLQILVLAMLLIAMARPMLHSTAQLGDRLIILLDHSASMNATDIAPTRLDQAKKIALELIDNLGHNGQTGTIGGAMVIAFADHGQVIQPLTTDRTLLRQAVRSIEPTDLPTRLVPALRLIEPLTKNPSASDNHGSVVAYVISDGALEDLKPPAIQGLDLRYLRVGRQADNLAIVSLSGRRDLKNPHRVDIFARLANYGTQPIHTNLTLKLNGQIQRVIPVTVPGTQAQVPGTEPLRIELDLPSSAILELSHDHSDPLSADDTAWLTLMPARALNVLLVTEGNGFLTQSIESTSVHKLIHMTADQYESGNPGQRKRSGGPADDGLDVIVFDGYRPQKIPTVNSLYFASVPPVDQLSLQPTRSHATSRQVILDWKRDHPLMAHTALDDLMINQARQLALPDTAQVLATGQTGPVVALVTADGVHHVVVGFDILNSNWPLQISFPVFVSNCMQWLGAHGYPAVGITLRPGQVMPVPIDNAIDPPQYSGPATATWGRLQNRSLRPPFQRVGLYQSNQDVPPPWDRLGVSLLSPAESKLQPADQIHAGTSSVGAANGTTSIRHEIWPWFAAMALVALMAEWVVYTRRLHL